MRLLSLLQNAFVEHGAQFKPEELMNTVWAFATLGAAAPEFFDALAAEVVSRQLAAFKPQELSNLAWAYARVRRPAPARLMLNHNCPHCRAKVNIHRPVRGLVTICLL